MLRPPRALLLALAAVCLAITPAVADHVPLNLRYHRISLSNGRILKDVTLNSLNRESGIIYVLEDKQLKPYPRALFPGFVTDRIDARAAEEPAAPTRDEPTAPPPTKAPDRLAPGAPGDTSPEALAAREAAILDAVAAKAREAALRHLRYKIRTGSGYTTVTDADVELDPPEPVAGWTHRYRVRGDGFYSYYESVGGAFHRRSRGIEIILEAPSPSRVKVLDLTTTWGSLLD